MVFDRLTPVWLRPTAEAVLRGHSLKDKCAVITGGTAGIGLATAKALVGADANVIIASRSRAKGDKVASELHSRQVRYALGQTTALHKTLCFSKELIAQGNLDQCLAGEGGGSAARPDRHMQHTAPCR